MNKPNTPRTPHTPIAPQHPQRTCHDVGICLHPTAACGKVCQQHTGGPTMQRLFTQPLPTHCAAPTGHAELPAPTLPFEMEGPYRRHSSHRRMGLNNSERLALGLMVLASGLTAVALLYVLGLAVVGAVNGVSGLLALVWS